MAGHYDAHTSTLLGEGMGIDQALGFHLTCRVFPDRSEMYGPALAAIKAVNAGHPERRISLKGICTWRGNKTAPAEAIVEHLNLWCFLNDAGEARTMTYLNDNGGCYDLPEQPKEREYTVSWVIQVWAESPEDALRQGLGACEDGIRYRTGASMWYVDDALSGERHRLDLEELGEEGR